MPAKLDLAGHRFGRLVAIKRVEDGRWLCRCDCGESTFARLGNLRRKRHLSCGCLQREAVAKRNFRHGDAHRDAKTTEYNIWRGMMQRCYYPDHIGYKHYGGRGIIVCDRWHTFENFLADMGRKPKGMSLDRVDNDGNYEPGNCRWATGSEQQQNKRLRVVK